MIGGRFIRRGGANSPKGCGGRIGLLRPSRDGQRGQFSKFGYICWPGNSSRQYRRQYIKHDPIRSVEFMSFVKTYGYSKLKLTLEEWELTELLLPEWEL